MLNEIMLMHVLNELVKWLIKSIDIKAETRTRSQVQTNARHDLRDLFERTNASWKRHENIAEFDHLRFAFTHVLDHIKLGQILLLNTRVDEELRLNAIHFATMLEHHA